MTRPPFYSQATGFLRCPAACQEVFKHFDKDGDQLLNASDMLSFAAWCQPQWLDVACHDFSTLHAFSPDSSQKMHVIETAWLTVRPVRQHWDCRIGAVQNAAIKGLPRPSAGKSELGFEVSQ